MNTPQLKQTMSLYDFYLFMTGEADKLKRWHELVDPDADLKAQARERMVERFMDLPKKYDLTWWQRMIVNWLLRRFEQNNRLRQRALGLTVKAKP